MLCLTYSSNFLLNLGQGKEEIFEDLGDFTVQIPKDYLVRSSEELIQKVFPRLGTDEMNTSDLINGAIYTPLNVDSQEINNLCLDKVHGASRTYLSADSILEQDHQEVVPPEFLNNISIGGMADHQLHLKVGCPVILLRNLQGGLRNGTRMIVISMMDRVLECEVAVGAQKGKRVFLPRIPMHDRSDEFPFTIVRRQFPVRLAFCLTINKGQGQSNERVGLYLPSPVFAHGQLYTGFSRGKRTADVHVFIRDNEDGFTDNVVYPELLGG